MDDPKKLIMEEFDLEQLLRIRNDLERYIEVIDEHVITSKTDLKGLITYTSKAFVEISGFNEQEMLGKSHNIVRHPDMPELLFKNLWETITQEKTWSGEIKNQKKDGTYYWVNAKITPNYDYHGNHIGYTSVRQDITDKKKIEEISITDELTGLYNRRYFNQIISTEINRAYRDKKVFSFIVLDVDHFKKYNDNYGHQKGDNILQQVGSYLIQGLKRATDKTFRLGGEEFGLFYSTNKIHNAVALAEKLCKGLEDLRIEHEYSTTSKYITASLGLAICDFTSKKYTNITKDILYDIADKALYKAKKLGRNQVFATQVV